MDTLFATTATCQQKPAKIRVWVNSSAPPEIQAVFDRIVAAHRKRSRRSHSLRMHSLKPLIRAWWNF